MKGYLRVRDHALFPSLKDTDLLLLNGAFAELEADAKSPLTLVPPSMIGPPELVHIDRTATAIPGIVTREFGRGRITWVAVGPRGPRLPPESARSRCAVSRRL